MDGPASAPEATGPHTVVGQAASTSTPPRRRRVHLKWAQLPRRVFSFDALECPQCQAAMVVLAFISDPPVVSKILRHLKLHARHPNSVDPGGVGFKYRRQSNHALAITFVGV